MSTPSPQPTDLAYPCRLVQFHTYSGPDGSWLKKEYQLEPHPGEFVCVQVTEKTGEESDPGS